MNLNQIKRELESFRFHPLMPVDEKHEYAADLLRDAYELALSQGIDYRLVKEYCAPAQALLEVNRLIAASEPTEFLSVTKAAKVMGVA